MLRKKRNENNSLTLRRFFVLIALFLRFSGPINGDPSSRYWIASRWRHGPRYSHPGGVGALLDRREHAIKAKCGNSVDCETIMQIIIRAYKTRWSS